MSARFYVVLLALMGFVAPAAADSWKDESGMGWVEGFHAPGTYYEMKPGKYEWQAGGCKYEYKVDGGGFKEEYKCDHGGPYAALLPPTPFVPHGFVVQGSPSPRFLLGPQVVAEAGRYCREYQKQVWVAAGLQEAYGTACRQPDGAWELVD